MTEIPEDYALDGIVSAEAFADEAARLGRQTQMLSALVVALVVALLLVGTILDGQALPSLTIMLKAFDKPMRRAMSDVEETRLLIGWVIVIVGVIGLLAIQLRYRRHLRYGSTARYCQLLGLYYILDRRIRRRFTADRFAELGLVPRYHGVRPDDLVGWGDAQHTLIFAEVRLLKHSLLQKTAQQVFRGSLLFVEAEKAYMALRGMEPRSFDFYRDAAGTWRAGRASAHRAPGFQDFVDRVASLATVLQATEAKAVLADDGFYVALAHYRQAFPIPSFWRRSGDRSCFAQIGRDLQALAGLAHALAPGTEASRWFQDLPEQVTGRHGIRTLLLTVSAVVLGLFVLAVTFLR